MARVEQAALRDERRSMVYLEDYFKDLVRAAKRHSAHARWRGLSGA